MEFKMADMNFLYHCVQWIRNLSERQEVVVDIIVEDLKFIFENKEKVKNSSQIKRDETRRKHIKSLYGQKVNGVSDYDLKTDTDNIDIQW